MLYGIHNAVAGSEEVTTILRDGWKEKVGGSIEFEPDIDLLIEKALARIDAKREALGLAPYDPERFGESGDRQMEELVREVGADEAVGLYSVPSVGSAGNSSK